MADGDLSEAFAWAEKNLGRELWPRERQFIATGGKAYPVEFDWKDAKQPETMTDENRFDARLIRWLLAKQIPDLTCRHEGIELGGLWIEKKLNLVAITCERAISATGCVFRNQILLNDIHLNGLNFSYSIIPRMEADRLKSDGPLKLVSECDVKEGVSLAGARIAGTLDCARSVFGETDGVALDCSNTIIGSHVYLDNMFRANGEVTFLDARVAGKILCKGSSFSAFASRALNCDAAVIESDVFLNEGFQSKGNVSFERAQIIGQLDCTGGKFMAVKGPALNCKSAVIKADVLLKNEFAASGELNFASADVTGNLQCESATIEGVFDIEAAKIGSGFFWKKISGNIKVLKLIETRLARLNDDVTSWRCVETLELSGLRYDSIQSDMTVQDRLALLERKWERAIPLPSGEESKRKDFDPQPYSHLAKVYDTMGHRGDAAKVRLRRDVRLASARLARAITGSTWSSTAVLSVLLALVSFLWSQLYRATFGFGYAPFRAFGTALVILLGAYVLAENTYQRGEFAPASPVVLASPEWLIASAFGCPGAQEPGCTMPLRRWEQSVAYRDYETFSPALYALDLFLPLDTLAQEESWAPSKDRGPWGWTLYWGRWLIQLSGWLLLTTAAAVFSGVLGKKD